MSFVLCLHCLKEYVDSAKLQNVFCSLMLFFLAKVMFWCNFLGNISAEWNEICCASSLNSTLATYTGIFLHYYFLSNKIVIVVFFTHRIFTNVLFSKTKNTRVRFFIYISSMCVQLFTAFQLAVLELYVPW